MKNHCALLAVVLVSLFAFGVANAEIEFGGVLEPGVSVTRIDSVTLVPPHVSFYTPGWGSHTPLDTHDFVGVTAWPETITLYGTINALPCRQTIPHPLPRVWNWLGVDPGPPQVLFWSDLSGVGESKSMVECQPCLAVSPSVVTAQMTVRLQPVGAGRQVVEIHDAAGNVVRSLGCTAGADGAATATWNREDEFGRLVPEGVYFCRYAAADVIAVRKVLVAR